MDAKTCLQKLQFVGVLAFATVDACDAPQIRNISAIHYFPQKRLRKLRYRQLWIFCRQTKGWKRMKNDLFAERKVLWRQ